MAGQPPTNSVWSAMNYKPPRGHCNHKPSIMSPACACLRFMLHPVKVRQTEISLLIFHKPYLSLTSILELLGLALLTLFTLTPPLLGRNEF